jgi:transglutaminase-like putative cysteine protease
MGRLIWPKGLSIGIVAFWVIMMWLLVERVYFNPADEYLEPEAIGSENRIPLGERWMGIYFKGAKIGYAHETVQEDSHGYSIEEKISMSLRVLEHSQKVDMITECVADRKFNLRSFHFDLSTGSTHMRIDGQVVGRKLALKIHSGGTVTERVVPFEYLPFLTNNLRPFLAQRGLEADKRYRVSIFDPSTMSLNKVSVVVVGREKITVGDADHMANRLRLSYRGIGVDIWLDDEGSVLKEESPMGLVLFREDKHVAQEVGSGAQIDIVQTVAVRSNIPIEDPRGVSFLKVRLKRIPLMKFEMNDGRQKLTGDVLQIIREEWPDSPSTALPSNGKEVKESLRPTALIQCDHPLIRSKASKIVGSKEGTIGAIQATNEWVYRHIEKKPTLSVPSALEVLESRVGDCNEHAVLLVALLRSLGVPSRPCVGVIYFRDGFYYHAWAEVWIGRWVTVDPTLNQLPADATHIKFVHGDIEDWADLLKIIGTLEVEVLDYR